MAGMEGLRRNERVVEERIRGLLDEAWDVFFAMPGDPEAEFAAFRDGITAARAALTRLAARRDADSPQVVGPVGWDPEWSKAERRPARPSPEVERRRCEVERETKEQVAAERARVEPIRRAFESAYGVKPYDAESRRLLAMFLGCGEDEFDLELLFGPESPFDHLELWGRDGKPLFLVGHPYQIDSEAHESLDAIRSLDLVVKVLDPSYSWYGFGSLQVVVYPARALAACCPDRPTYPWPA